MVDVNVNDTQNENIVISVGSDNGGVNLDVTGDKYYTDLAKQWAIEMNGKIQGIDYSSKYYAQQSRDYKNDIENYIDEFNNTVDNATNSAVSTITTTLENSIDTLSDTKDYILNDLNSTAGNLNDTLQATGTIQNTRLVNTGDYCTSEMETLLTGAQNAEKNAKESEEKAKEYADKASKGQIQADYAETDTTEKSYIKNKPDLSVYVTTDTAQDISGRKTFFGEKAIYFKQNATSDKLGFTLYNPNNSELGAFEFRPGTINGGALLNVNVPATSSNYVGFRYWGTPATNIVAPKVGGDYYIPVNITNGTTTVTANNAGTIDISTLLTAALSDYVPQTQLATTEQTGIIKPDGVTLKTDENGTISADIENITGKWIAKDAALSNRTTTGKSTIDLSDYLPDNNYDYKVQIQLLIHQNQSGKTSQAEVHSPFYQGTLSGMIYASTVYGFQDNTGELIIPKDNQTLTLNIINDAPSYCLLDAYAYKRL